MLQGGVWCQLDLVYNADDDEAQRLFYIAGLRPIQVAALDMDAYKEGRARFNRDEWLDLLMRSIGLEPTQYDLRGKLLAMERLVPLAERNYNLIELDHGEQASPTSTARRRPTRSSFPAGRSLCRSSSFTLHRAGRLVGTWDVVAFDEVAALELSDTTVVQILKDYMESGSFARGREEIPAEASCVFIGNTTKPAQELVREAHLFADLPRAMVDPAFLDRLHFYLPGWETPKLEKRLFTNHYGFVSDYLAEAVRELRKQSFTRARRGLRARRPSERTRRKGGAKDGVGAAQASAPARRVDAR